ncbi:hypothetical protein IMY05_C4748000100 [Salix suchowensis]|nr:hypothetical protein IMY05_C4748000100 [Salix suchowensis]
MEDGLHQPEIQRRMQGKNCGYEGVEEPTDYKEWLEVERKRFKDLQGKAITAQLGDEALCKVLLDARWNPEVYGKSNRSDTFAKFLNYMDDHPIMREAIGNERPNTMETLRRLTGKHSSITTQATKGRTIRWCSGSRALRSSEQARMQGVVATKEMVDYVEGSGMSEGHNLEFLESVTQATKIALSKLSKSRECDGEDDGYGMRSIDDIGERVIKMAREGDSIQSGNTGKRASEKSGSTNKKKKGNDQGKNEKLTSAAHVEQFTGEVGFDWPIGVRREQAHPVRPAGSHQ